MRRFQAGQTGDFNGIQWRIVNGKKHPEDLRLDICSPSWRSIPMALSFLEADFFTENERVLYPNGDRDKYLKFLRGAVILGWEVAHDQLEEEKRRKRERGTEAA